MAASAGSTSPSTQDRSASCEERELRLRGRRRAPAARRPARLPAAAVRRPEQVRADQRRAGTIQFQSLTFNPENPRNDLLGGTQDNGTWAYSGGQAWTEIIGGDGGQSGFDAGNPQIRYHNYFDATPEVNFHGNDPRTWINIYDAFQSDVAENRSFYTPFEADPTVPGRAITGLEHVWRTDDNGGAGERRWPLAARR